MHPLEQKIHAAKAKGRMAVIPFLTAGFPTPEGFWKHLEETDQAGADIIEIGIPFSDPVADGPVVEEASRRALANGITLSDVLSGLAERKGRFNAGIVLMGYFNPFYQHGLKKLAKEAAEAGVSGVIIPDLPLEESEEARRELDQEWIALICLVGPNTSRERMELYAPHAKGYAYVVSVMGTTGERKNLAPAVAETMRRARSAFSVPLALGFGLSKPEQLDALPADAKPDAAVMGSALLRHIDAGKPVRDFLRDWIE